MDYHCAKFGDFSFRRFGLVLSCGQTHRIRHKITDVDDRYTHATIPSA